MVSDNSAQTYEQGERLGLRPYMGQWMAHWMQACKTWSPKGCERHHNTAHVRKIVDQFKRHECLAVEQFSSKKLKPLPLDINQSYTSGCKGQSSSVVGNVDQISHVLQSGGTAEGDWGKVRFTDKSAMRNNLELLDDKITFSDSQKLTESFIKWKSATSYHSSNLDDFGSKNKHLPVFDINRKVETIMDSREESYHDAMFVKSPLSSSVVDFAPGSCIIGNTKKATRYYECFRPDCTDNVGTSSSLAILGRKCKKKTNNTSCMFSCGSAFKVLANTELSCRQHKLCCCSSNNKSISKETKENVDSISKSFGNSRMSVKDGFPHVLREPSTNHFPNQFSTEEHGKNVIDDSTNRLWLGNKRRTQQVCSDLHLWPSKVPKFSMLDVSQHGSYQNLKSVENGEGFRKYSSRVNSLPVADEMGLDRCQLEVMTRETAFTEVREISFSETFIMPTKHYCGEKATTIGTFKNFKSDENIRGDGGIGTHFMGVNNESSTEADTMYHNPFHRSSSILGETVSMLPKRFASTSQAQETPCKSAETRTFDRLDPPASTETATVPINKESADEFSSHINIADISNSSLLRDNASELETCSRWVERLRHKTLPTNWFQTCDGSSSEVQNICNYKFEKTIPLSDNNNPSSIDTEEALQPRIRRCRRNCHRPVAAVTFLPVNGKKFASIRAMALMGNLIKNYKPRKFQRKEASVIWTV